MPGTAKWEVGNLYAPGVAGTVTATPISRPTVVDVGVVAISVNLREAFAAEGDVPLTRSLRRGDSGQDVLQVNEFLRTLGLLQAESSSPEFTNDTRDAWRTWQRFIGQPVDGIVSQGDLVFFPSLPVVANSVPTVGQAIGGADAAFHVWPAAPVLTLQLGGSLVGEVSVDTTAMVALGSRSLVGALSPATPAESDGVENAGGITYRIVDPDDVGIDLCVANECGAPPSAETSLTFEVTIEVIPSETGLMLPATAVGVDASGQTYVRDGSGEVIEVQVGGNQDGLVLVRSGLSEEARVLADVQAVVPQP